MGKIYKLVIVAAIGILSFILYDDWASREGDRKDGIGFSMPVDSGFYCVTGAVSDLSFIVFDPDSEHMVGVWVGLPENEFPLRLKDGFSGGRTAAPIAAQIWRQLPGR